MVRCQCENDPSAVAISLKSVIELAISALMFLQSVAIFGSVLETDGSPSIWSTAAVKISSRSLDAVTKSRK